MSSLADKESETQSQSTRSTEVRTHGLQDHGLQVHLLLEVSRKVVYFLPLTNIPFKF